MPYGGAFCPLPIRLGGSAEEGWAPEQQARFAADLIAIKRVAPLASWSYSVNGTEATVLAYVGQNGSGLAYAPTAVRNANGDVSFTWASQYFEDEYGVQEPFRIRGVICKAAGSSAASVTWEVITRGVRLRRRTDTGGLQNGTAHVRVW